MVTFVLLVVSKHCKYVQIHCEKQISRSFQSSILAFLQAPNSTCEAVKILNTIWALLTKIINKSPSSKDSSKSSITSFRDYSRYSYTPPPSSVERVRGSAAHSSHKNFARGFQFGSPTAPALTELAQGSTYKHSDSDAASDSSYGGSYIRRIGSPAFTSDDTDSYFASSPTPSSSILPSEHFATREESPLRTTAHVIPYDSTDPEIFPLPISYEEYMTRKRRPNNKAT